MSLRAELVRLGLRWFVKRKIGPATTLEALRRQDAFLERLVPPPPKGTQATHVDLDGVKAVAVVTLASLGGGLVLYLHGGGHVSGSPALYGDFTWRIAAATRARTVILDHRLAPEHPFPAALDDAVTAYRALVADGVDPRRMAVLGESSGGGLVLAMLLKLRDEGFRLPAAAVALSPWTDLALTGGSLRRNAEADPMLRATEGAPRELLSRRRRSSHTVCVAALRRPDRTAADAHPSRQRRDPARRFSTHGGADARRWMSGRARNMAADAAHLAGLGAGPSGSARGHRAHRRVRAEQDVVDAILHRCALALDTSQMLVEARSPGNIPDSE